MKISEILYDEGLNTQEISDIALYSKVLFEHLGNKVDRPGKFVRDSILSKL